MRDNFFTFIINGFLMNKETFNTLLEIQSCSRNIIDLNKKIDEENNRVLFVQKNIDRKIEEIKENKINLANKKNLAKKIESEVEEIQNLIERTNKNLTQATNTQQAESAEKELNNLNPRSQELEDSLFTIWEEIETLQGITNEESNYETGAAKSIEKLKHEVKDLVREKELEIEKYSRRKDELLQGLPTGLANTFEQIEKNKNPAVCFMDNKKCTSCMTLLDQAMISEINSHHHLCHCPTCGRILISPDVRY